MSPHKRNIIEPFSFFRYIKDYFLFQLYFHFLINRNRYCCKHTNSRKTIFYITYYSCVSIMDTWLNVLDVKSL